MLDIRIFKTFGYKHIGGRDSQQDAFYEDCDDKRIVMVLADGMGGHRGGEIASKIVADATKKLFKNTMDTDISANDFFKRLIPFIHKIILQKGEERNISPHTTIVIAMIQDGYIHYAHIGDSRLYIFDRDGLIARTRDHSVPEMLFQMGSISEEEMATHPDQNKLTKSLGGERLESCTLDKYEINPSKEYAIILCSDGLWEYFQDKEMHKELFRVGSTELEIKKLVHDMIARVNKVGGKNRDNISLIIAKNQPILCKNQSYSNKLLFIFNNKLIFSLLACLMILIGVLIAKSFDSSSLPLPSDKNTSDKNNSMENNTSKDSNKSENNNFNQIEENVKKVKEFLVELKKEINKTKGNKAKASIYQKIIDKYKEDIKKVSDTELTSHMKKANKAIEDEEYRTAVSEYKKIINSLEKLIKKSKKQK